MPVGGLYSFASQRRGIPAARRTDGVWSTETTPAISTSFRESTIEDLKKPHRICAMTAIGCLFVDNISYTLKPSFFRKNLQPYRVEQLVPGSCQIPVSGTLAL
jgi:hypothetical protein